MAASASTRHGRWTSALGRSAVLSAAACFCVGCGGGSDGPVRYPLSGNVVFADQPLKSANIQFVPDSTKDNDGPVATAAVRDGRFETESGKGTVGGPHIVRIIAYQGGQDGSGNLAPLFPMYEERVDLPKEAATHDIAIPASHGQTAGQ